MRPLVFLFFLLSISQKFAFSLETLPAAPLAYLCFFLEEETVENLRHTSKTLYKNLNKDLVRKTFLERRFYSRYQVIREYSDFCKLKSRGLYHGNFKLCFHTKQDLKLFLEDTQVQEGTYKLLIATLLWAELETQFLQDTFPHFHKLKALGFSKFHYPLLHKNGHEIYNKILEDLISLFPHFLDLEEFNYYCEQRRINDNIFHKLLLALPQLKSLKILSLNIKCPLKDTNYLGEILCQLKDLEYIKLGSYFSSIDADILNYIPTLQKLKSLSLCCYRLNSFEPILSLQNLQSWDLEGCNIRINGALIILPVLEKFQHQLKELGLGTNKLQDKGLKRLTPILANCHHLESLSLEGNELTGKSAPYLARIFQNVKKLKKLNLSWNWNLCLNFSQDLAPSLAHLRNLQILLLLCTQVPTKLENWTALGNLIKEDLIHLKEISLDEIYEPEDPEKTPEFEILVPAMYKEPKLTYLAFCCSRTIFLQLCRLINTFSFL